MNSNRGTRPSAKSFAALSRGATGSVFPPSPGAEEERGFGAEAAASGARRPETKKALPEGKAFL